MAWGVILSFILPIFSLWSLAYYRGQHHLKHTTCLRTFASEHFFLSTDNRSSECYNSIQCYNLSCPLVLLCDQCSSQNGTQCLCPTSLKINCINLSITCTFFLRHSLFLMFDMIRLSNLLSLKVARFNNWLWNKIVVVAIKASEHLVACHEYWVKPL